MSPFAWIVHDAGGNDLSTTESFPTKDEAEAWLGAEWSGLAEASGDSVSLVEDGEVVYRMSLQPE
jgi:hypothetical protein